jgi:hypothetical protein
MVTLTTALHSPEKVNTQHRDTENRDIHREFKNKRQ